MEISPYLSGIQSINGQTPTDKFKELHAVVRQIINNEKEKIEFIKTGVSQRVQPALLPYLRILVGNELKQSDAVIEALKSDDIPVIKKALNAKWFFNSSNALICANYFVENIMPYVTLRTRLELIKTLTSCLANEPEKGNEFFGCFADLYGVEQVLPLILACSQDYIFDAILKRRINLPCRLLSALYRKYPNLVIRYLQLGNNTNESNIQDRKQHTISVVDYDRFLPALIKNHIHIYIRLYMKDFNWPRLIKLGNTRAKFFLKYATNVLIKHPSIFLDRLPLKLVSNKLTTQQFETMYDNLFPNNRHSYRHHIMFDYLKYYPEQKKLNLMREKYRKHYNQELLELKDIASFELYKLLPADEKEKVCRKMIEPHLNTALHYNYLYWLPPKEAIPLLKKKLSKISDERGRYFRVMIQSCGIYKSMDDLRDLLWDYNVYHRNESADVLNYFLCTLTEMFNLGNLPPSHWKVLREILHQAYIRGDLFTALEDTYQRFFNQALQFYLKHCKTNAADKESRNFLQKLVNIVLEGYMEHNMQWEFISDYRELGLDCLQKFLAILPRKYPVKHCVWDNFKNKLSLVLYLVQTIHSFNVKNMHTVKSKNGSNGSTLVIDSEDNKMRYKKFAIQSYDWLVKLTTDVLKKKDRATGRRSRIKYSMLRKILQKHDAVLYESLVDNDPNLIYECETSDAVVVLKRNSQKIMSKWKLYLKECKKLVQHRSRSFKSFIKALKWYQVIPIRFVEQCIQQLDSKDNMLILGILLEGKVFTKIVHPLLPKEMMFNLDEKAAKIAYIMSMWLISAMNCTTPPITLDIFLKFCQGGYVSLASQMLRNIGQRVPINRLLELATKLVDNKTNLVRKLGIILMCQVTSKTESRIFLANIWNREDDISIRRMLVQMIFEVFQHSANNESWKMMKVCINSLTNDDLVVLKSLNKINVVDKDFVNVYIIELLKKFDEIPEATDTHKMLKSIFLKDLCSSINESIIHRLPEELLMNIVRSDLFCKNTDFIIYQYLMADESKFEERLENLIVILNEKTKDFDKPKGNLAREYPIKSGFYRFFNDVSSIFFRDINRHTATQLELKIRILDEILKFITTSLKPIQIPYCYILLKMTKDRLESRTIEDCATRFVKTVKHVIKELGSEIIWKMIADAFVAVMPNPLDLMWRKSEPDMLLDIVEAMMGIDQQIGSMLGILALNRSKVREYNEKYDLLVQTWKEMDDVMVQVFLNQFQIDLNE